MMFNFDVALFDLDGTIIDTEPYHFLCWNNILAKYGCQLNYDYYLNNYAGVSIDGNCKMLMKEYDLDLSTTELRHAKERMMIELLNSNNLAPMHFVREFIDLLRHQRISLGLVTSSSQEEASIILKGLQLDKVFNCTITRNDVKNMKPHPEPYLLAQSRFNANLDRFIVFEDSISGIQSAKKAGMKCFAVRGNIAQSSPYYQLADKVFGDFMELRDMMFDDNLIQEGKGQ